MCETAAGTLRTATVKHSLPSQIFPKPSRQDASDLADVQKTVPNSSRRRVDVSRRHRSASDEFKDEDLDDADFMHAAKAEKCFEPIDNFSDSAMEDLDLGNNRPKAIRVASTHKDEMEEWKPVRLHNGKYECNHQCKNKLACKHLCCREGLDKAPKGPPKRVAETAPSGTQRPTKSSKKGDRGQTKLNLNVTKKSQRGENEDVAEIDLTKGANRRKSDHAMNASHDYKNLDRLHKKVQEAPGKPKKTVPNITHTKPSYSYADGSSLGLSFLQNHDNDGSSDYGDITLEDNDVPAFDLFPPPVKAKFSLDDDEDFPSTQDDFFANDQAIRLDNEGVQMLETSNDDLADSENLQPEQVRAGEEDFDALFDEPAFDIYKDPSRSTKSLPLKPQQNRPQNPLEMEKKTPSRNKSLFVGDSSSSVMKSTDIESSYFGGHQPLALETVSKDGKENADTRITVPDPIETTGEEAKEPAPIVPPGYEGIDPWLMAELGDFVEFT